MDFSATVIGTVILGCVINVIHASDNCYSAKTCIHDGKEKCGKNGAGKVRRFIDSCDIKEYNCLKNNDYEKTSFQDCKSLPPLNKPAESLLNNESEENVDKSEEAKSKTKEETTKIKGVISADDPGKSSDSENVEH